MNLALDKPQADTTAVHGIVTKILSNDTLFLLLLLIWFGIAATFLSPNFFSLQNILNVTRIVSLTGIVAIGMTFVLLVGEIDLSVGSIISISAVLGGKYLDSGILPVLAITYGTGACLGLINGIGTVKGKVPSIIMTLATLSAYAGLASIVSRGAAVWTYAHPSYTWIGQGEILGLPFPVILFLALALLSVITLHYTRFGRWVYYTGDNRVASHYAGVNTDRIRIIGDHPERHPPADLPL